MKRAKIQVPPGQRLPLLAESWQGTKQEVCASYRFILDQTNNTEAILRCLRQIGHDKSVSILILYALKNLPYGKAKEFVHYSETWKDRRELDASYQNKFFECLSRFASKKRPGVRVLKRTQQRIHVRIDLKKGSICGNARDSYRIRLGKRRHAS